VYPANIQGNSTRTRDPIAALFKSDAPQYKSAFNAKQTHLETDSRSSLSIQLFLRVAL
jgi:hypothetical protein